MTTLDHLKQENPNSWYLKDRASRERKLSAPDLTYHQALKQNKDLKKMTNFFQITVSLKSGHENMIFNRFEGKFVKNADENTAYKTEQEARYDLENARNAWNEFDEISVEEINVEAE